MKIVPPEFDLDVEFTPKWDVYHYIISTSLCLVVYVASSVGRVVLGRQRVPSCC